MKYKAALFDLDGTLLDTLDDIAISANNILKRNGYPVHPVEKYRYFVGNGMEMLIRRILPDNVKDETVVKCILKKMKDEYNSGWKKTTKPYPGITEMLNRLQEQKIRLSVLSNKPHEFTTEHVKYFFPDLKFDAVFGINEQIPAKPDPAGAFKISEILGIPPEEFIYAGDTGTDMKTAAATGMFAVGVLWGFREKEELVKNGAKKIISRPEELLELIA